MAVNNVTITGKLGPGITTTALVLNNVRSITFDYDENTLTVSYVDASGAPKIQSWDLYGIATVTYSITSHIATVVAST